MKYFFPKSFFLATLLLLGAGSTTAQVGGVVHDPLALATAVEQFATRITKMDQTIRAQTGSRGLGDLINSDVYRNYRRQLPWETTVTIEKLSRGEYPSDIDSMSQVLRGLAGLYRLWEDSTTIQDPQERRRLQTQARRTRTASSAVAASAAQIALASTEQNVDDLEQLIAEINQTEDIKASQDLSARIMAQNGFLLNQLLNLEANDLANKTTRELSDQKIEDFEKWDRGF